MGWRDAFRGWRNRMLADPAFQKRSAGFALTRPMARMSATSLFDLCAGFVYTQVLLACVELNVFDRVRDGPIAVDAFAKAADMPVDGAERLMKAAAALQLLERFDDGRFGLGFKGAALLGNPSVFDMIRHHAVLYRDLADPVGLLRDRAQGTALSDYWGYAESDDPRALGGDRTNAYTRLMAATQAFIAQEVLDAYAFAQHRRLLDVGGGGGAFVEAVARAVPGLKLSLFDLPAVADAAAVRLAGVGLTDRIEAVGGDFFNDPLPDHADLVTLVRILHDHDEEDAMRLLRNIRRSLKPGGTLIIAEPMAGTRGAEAMGDAYFGMYLWAMGSGEPRTQEKISAMAREAGFSEIRSLKTAQPLLTRALALQ